MSQIRIILNDLVLLPTKISRRDDLVMNRSEIVLMARSCCVMLLGNVALEQVLGRERALQGNDRLVMGVC